MECVKPNVYNPLTWSTKIVKLITALFFIIALPIYIYIGLQPAAAIDVQAYPRLQIPDLALDTAVAPLKLNAQQELIAPATIAGAFQQNPQKTLIIGHSTAVFKRLHQAQPGSTFTYQDQLYRITKSEILSIDNINMRQILAPTQRPTIIIMTCAGQALGHHKYSHRLLISASLI